MPQYQQSQNTRTFQVAKVTDSIFGFYNFTLLCSLSSRAGSST